MLQRSPIQNATQTCKTDSSDTIATEQAILIHSIKRHTYNLFCCSLIIMYRLQELADRKDVLWRKIEKHRCEVEDDLGLIGGKRSDSSSSADGGGAVRIVECNSFGFVFRVTKKDQRVVKVCRGSILFVLEGGFGCKTGVQAEAVYNRSVLLLKWCTAALLLLHNAVFKVK